MIGDSGCSAYYWVDPVQDSLIIDYGVETDSYPGRDYLWDFGDGYTSRDSVGRHTYRDSGVYTVKLSVVNNAVSCNSNYTQNITVGNVPCSADFNVVPQSGNVVKFNTSKGGATYFYWDFGDGNYSTDANPVNSYQQAGKYDVQLSVWNESGCYNYSDKSIIVGDVSALTIADFTYFIATDNKTVTFTNKSTKAANEFYWTYGDGYDDTIKNPVHVYYYQDYYTVCLTAYNDSNESSDYICQDIQVGNAECNVTANFNYTIPNQDSLIVDFYDNSSGNYDTYYWDFGDGYIDTTKNTVHKYDSPGYYWAGLSVQESGTWCVDYYYQYILVGNVDCKADFKYTVDKNAMKVTLQDNSKGSIEYYYWYCDDGYSSEDKNTEHVFDDPGPALCRFSNRRFVRCMYGLYRKGNPGWRSRLQCTIYLYDQ